MNHYWQLIKPNITMLFVVTGLTAMIVEGGTLFDNPWQGFAVLLAIFCTGASANAFNQYLERDLDAQMERTRKKRPIPQGHISPNSAFLFVVITGIIGVLLLVWQANLLSAALAATVIFFYGFVYTLWLKPRTPYNIVIGGVPGAMAPLIAWAAATGGLNWTPWMMFGLVFMWTPPHFWALAIKIREEYAGVAIPMLPVVKGVRWTQWEILIYALLLIPISLSFYWPLKVAGLPYLLVASLLNALFVQKTLRMMKTRDDQDAYRLFLYSILYLFGLFLMLMLDHYV